MSATQTVPTFEEEVSPGRVLTMPADGTGLSVLDPWLSPFDNALRERYVNIYSEHTCRLSDAV